MLKIRIRWPTGSRLFGATIPTARRPAEAWFGATGPEALLTKAHLVAVMAAIGDLAGSHRPMPGDLEWKQPVLVLQSEHDRAFASQANEIRAVCPTAAFHVVAGAGHGALFTHTDQ
jgi:pimeloyl-ACP methyl ester carboxylesterase